MVEAGGQLGLFSDRRPNNDGRRQNVHELSLCEGVRSVIEDQLSGQDFRHVTIVRLEIGRFSCVEKDALRFAFDVAMKGSVVEGAELVMLDMPGRAMCYDCLVEVEIENRLDPCPNCSGGRLMPVAGDELRIKNVEVI
jgi:hydrogenase nickel incorporation protein HypA/HybF